MLAFLSSIVVVVIIAGCVIGLELILADAIDSTEGAEVLAAPVPFTYAS